MRRPGFALLLAPVPCRSWGHWPAAVTRQVAGRDSSTPCDVIGKDGYEGSTPEAPSGAWESCFHCNDHDFLVGSAHAGGRTRTADELLGVQERAGAGVDPPFSAPAFASSAPRTLADGPIHSRLL